MHGRDFKPREEDWLDVSVAALSAGIERDFPDDAEQFRLLNKRCGYYGDLTGEFLTTQGQRYDEVLDVGDRRNALSSLQSIAR